MTQADPALRLAGRTALSPATPASADLSLVDLSLGTLQAAYRAGLRPSRLALHLLERIDAHADPAVWIGGPCAERLRTRARALDDLPPGTLPLQGVPFAVKDNIDVAGLPTTAGCPAFAYTATRDSPVVARLEAAGALLVGKTNLDQFATGLVGVRSPYGVPRNALVPDRVPGGSSSGSAVAVAAGLATFALGTDTAGSGRVPAMFNGIVGLKPTRGLLSTQGVVPACRTLDCLSVFALSIEDAAQVLGIATVFDPGDPFARPAPPGWSAAPTSPRHPLRLGVPAADARRFFGREAPHAAYEVALDRAASAGATIVEIDWAPFAETAALLYQGPWVAERALATAGLLERDPGAIHPVVRGILAQASRFDARAAFAAQYRLAELRRTAEAILAPLDALLLPTAPFVPSLGDVAAAPVEVNSQLGTYTNFVNLLDLAALAIPAGADAEGLPFGVTFVGPAWSEARLAGIALALGGQAAATWPATGWPSLEIAVFGAHMEGLPLHAQLQALGASDGRRIATSPGYRLFALPDGLRPALVAVNSGGAPIEGEAWSVPGAAIGALLAQVASPLALGPVQLECGRWICGFVCAGGAPPEATDVTQHGGWRGWLGRGSAAS